MRKTRRVILFLFLASLVLGSCGKLNEIEVGEPEGVSIRGFEDNAVMVDIALPVYNPSIYRIKIKDIDVRTFINGKYIGKINLGDDVVIKGKSNETIKLPVQIRVSNVLSMAFLMMKMNSGQIIEVGFEGSFTAKSILMKKTIEIDEQHEMKI